MLYLFRHGESLTNIKLDETCEFPLTDDNTVLTNRGMIHVMNTGMSLKDAGIRPDIIFTSPLTRARQTAYILASSIGHGCPIEVIPEFREIIWHSDKVFERHEKFKDISDCFETIDARPKTGLENQRDVYERVIPHMHNIITPVLEGKTVFCVSHFFVVKAQRAYIEQDDPEFMPHFDVKNAEPYCYTDQYLAKWKKS